MRQLFISSTAIWGTGSDTSSVASRDRTELTSSKCDWTRHAARWEAGGGSLPPPDFGGSVNPISTRGDTLSIPTQYYLPPRIFDPYCMPGHNTILKSPNFFDASKHYQIEFGDFVKFSAFSEYMNMKPNYISLDSVLNTACLQSIGSCFAYPVQCVIFLRLKDQNVFSLPSRFTK